MFRLRELWRSKSNFNDEYGVESFTSFVYNDNTYLVSGSFAGYLRFFSPKIEDDGLPITEIQLKYPILQIYFDELFKNNKNVLIVLHPKSIAFYSVKVEEDSTVIIKESHSQILAHSSYNFITTKFEGQNQPKTVLVQSIDGFLTSINENSMSTYKIPNFFLPGPFIYIPLLESFIFASADYRILCFRKNMIISSNDDEKVEEWSYTFGESVVGLNYYRTTSEYATSSNFEIAITGERKLAVLTDSGKIKTMMIHNGGGICSHGYVSEPEAKRFCNNLLLASIDKTVSIYINFQKVWQIVLEYVPLSLHIITIQPNKGVIAIMDDTGKMYAGYLGTSESGGLDIPALPRVSEEQLKDYLKKVNKRIENVPTANNLQILVNIAKSVPSRVELVLHPENKVKIKDVSCYFNTPLSIKEVSPIRVDKIKHECSYGIDLELTHGPPSTLSTVVTAIFKDSHDRQQTKSISFDIPYELFFESSGEKVKCDQSIILYPKGNFAEFSQILPTIMHQDQMHSFSIKLKTGTRISFSEDRKNKRYRVEAETYETLGFAISILSKGLFSATKSTLIAKEVLQLDSFGKIISQHHSLRNEIKNIKKKISGYISELEKVQKALISKYEASTPEPIDPLVDLFKVSTESLKKETMKLQELQKQLENSDASVEAAVFTTVTILSLVYESDPSTVDLIKQYLPYNASNCSPGWEECFYTSLNGLIEKLIGTKQTTTYGGDIEPLPSVKPIMQQMEYLLQILEKKKIKP